MRRNNYCHVKETFPTIFKNIEEAYNNKNHITGLKTGFADLDYNTRGLQKGELIVVATRPAMGKTAFSLNIATNIAIREKTPVAILSLDGSKEYISSRILCSEAMVEIIKTKTGKLEDRDWIRLEEAVEALVEAPIYIDDTLRNISKRNLCKMHETKKRKKYRTSCDRWFINC